MTREQIEAWLTLEGWVRRQAKGCVPLYIKDTHDAFYNNDRPYYAEQFRTETYFYNEVIPPDEYSDEQLKRIYQEIIKHEKD